MKREDGSGSGGHGGSGGRRLDQRYDLESYKLKWVAVILLIIVPETPQKESIIASQDHTLATG